MHGKNAYGGPGSENNVVQSPSQITLLLGFEQLFGLIPSQDRLQTPQDNPRPEQVHRQHMLPSSSAIVYKRTVPLTLSL